VQVAAERPVDELGQRVFVEAVRGVGHHARTPW
jgi:hypothetical protein